MKSSVKLRLDEIQVKSFITDTQNEQILLGGNSGPGETCGGAFCRSYLVQGSCANSGCDACATQANCPTIDVPSCVPCQTLPGLPGCGASEIGQFICM
ncbi:MAG: hypothetical protein H9535_08310 [Ignavibacteria bacterium]|nr:hypothetical protein [Ignavibacteria bacterium]